MAEHQVQDFSLRSMESVPKFDGTNIREWRYELNLRLQHLDINRIVEGTDISPEEVTNRRNPSCTCDQSRDLTQHGLS